MYEIEHTDTFGGEANYCWVRRYRVPNPPETASAMARRRYLVTKAKELTGLTGHRCQVEDYGDSLIIRPRGICQVVFVSWVEDATETCQAYAEHGYNCAGQPGHPGNHSNDVATTEGKS